MSLPIAVMLDRSSLDRDDLDFSSLTSLPYQWHYHEHTDPSQTAERISDASLVVSNKVVINRESMQQAKQLKLIAVAATGTNNIDLDAAGDLGIAVTNCTGYGTPSVVQHVFTLMLNLFTHIPQYQAAVARGDWAKSPVFCLLDYPINEISGKTLGIVGYGELGRGVARIAEAFGMKVLLAQRPGAEPQTGRIALPELLPQVDALTLHCPLTEHTQNLIGEPEFALMKPSAILINAARGGIVAEQALADALRQGQIAGAGVDVLSIEPPTGPNPLLESDLPNLIITPHCAWASREARQRMLDMVAGNIQDFANDKPTNRVV